MEKITKLFELIGSLPPLWRAIVLGLSLTAVGISMFFLTAACGTSKVFNTINNNASNNYNEVDINTESDPNTSVSLDSLYFPLTFDFNNK